MPDDRNPLLDAPASAPPWVPRVDDERSVRRLRWVIVAVAVIGVMAFIVRGATRPADPVLGASADGPPGAAAPGELPGLPSRVPLEGFDEIAIAITDAEGQVIGWCFLLAESSEQRQRGLMEVTDLQGYPGMLFTYDEDTTNAYFMRNTPTPLSIAWFDKDGELVSAVGMDPCGDVDGCPTYEPKGPYRYALEVPRGWLAEMSIGKGSRLEVLADGCAERSTG